MTVKCLDQNQKDFIAAAYRERVFESSELAVMHGVSQRTIQRILHECGVARSRVYNGRKPKAVQPQTPYVPSPVMDKPLPITMHEREPVFVPKLPPFPPKPKTIKEIVMDFIAKTILHFKK